jgi:High potential iron-sulfur protein
MMRASLAPAVNRQTRSKEVAMKQVADASRRRLLKNVTLGVALIPIVGIPLRTAVAADLPLVTPDDATAKALKYVSDASKAPDAKPGSKCATCSLYQGAAGSAQGGCLLFPGKAVKASGWCSSWTAKT